MKLAFQGINSGESGCTRGVSASTNLPHAFKGERKCKTIYSLSYQNIYQLKYWWGSEGTGIKNLTSGVQICCDRNSDKVKYKSETKKPSSASKRARGFLYSLRKSIFNCQDYNILKIKIQEKGGGKRCKMIYLLSYQSL